MKIKFEWELIYKSEDNITETWRAKTIGGWIVKDFNCIYTDSVSTVGNIGVSVYAELMNLFIKEQNLLLLDQLKILFLKMMRNRYGK